MLTSDVETCMSDLKNKKCEGFDRIPLCVLSDARETLLPPWACLFSSIYSTKQIPEQWKVAKIVPIFKKGSKTEMKNYKPIANLCGASKFFEKLILEQIHYLESKNKLDLSGKQQHDFKINKSTATAGALLLSLIARAAINLATWAIPKDSFISSSAMKSSLIQPSRISYREQNMHAWSGSHWDRPGFLTLP